MYLETGQGSALSAGAHLGTGGKPVDQQTLETRAYAVARDSIRCWSTPWSASSARSTSTTASRSSAPGWRTTSAASCSGLPMGVDVCYTNHAEADQDDMDTLLTLLGAAGAAFVIAVPGADDVMLGYQSLSFHDVLYVRQVLGLRPAPEFEALVAADSEWPTTPAGCCPIDAGGLAAAPADERRDEPRTRWPAGRPTPDRAVRRLLGRAAR